MFTTQKQKNNNRKKPPPRPPPPNFTKFKSKSTISLNQQENLIDWSPPSSPKVERNQQFGGSVSSSFSSSTSSLASSKKSFEFDLPVNWPTNSFVSHVSTNTTLGPTIIRAKGSKKPSRNNLEMLAIGLKGPDSPPMPSIPPPSPPKNVSDIDTPYGIALFDFNASQPSDLTLQVGDVVLLTKRINDDWLQGRVLDSEGIFPANFIELKVPLPEEKNIVTALYEFKAQMADDLNLKVGQKVNVTKIINTEWLYGTSNGRRGQFPSNYVDRIPKI
ncbi:unnamed protein product [Brassicogethes aeneus]|uniref:SH3 domain-containing protein n=1 Tax=Brassicogethes aeneus TaxID=1431903 RepID=A0A9P0BFE9_BRAAE|nr:unnamed protein product [Brassicogethes aeneus]